MNKNHCLDIDIPMYFAPKISEKSWLNDSEYDNFVAGYEYASTQTHAIHGLSKITPEEAYFIFEAIKRGIDMSPPICPNCGNNRQVWVNQITKKLTCHRFGCNNKELE
jgi:hypothetical protein